MRANADLIQTYLEFTSGHESTDRVRKWSFISVLAALLERRVYINRGYYTLFPNLYVFIIGKSGLIKKSTSTSIAVNLLREIKGIKMMSERLTAASLITQMSAAGKFYEHNGQRVAQSPLFAYASELAVFLVEVFGSITELLTTFYDCQPNDSKKPWVHETKGSGATTIFGPCLNVLGASTKAWLTKCIPRTEMEGGFTSRIIFVVEDRLPETLVAWPEVDPSLEQKRSSIIQDMLQIFSLCGQFKVTTEARTQFEEWYKWHMTEQMPNNLDPRMVGYMSRKGDTILKLAMIRSISLSNSMEITPSELTWALNELNELEPDWRNAFSGMGNKNSLAWEIRNYLRAKQTATQKDIIATFGQMASPTVIFQEINELIELNEVYQSSMNGEAIYAAIIS